MEEDDMQIRAIIEVKNPPREDLKDSLLMQEILELVGWLKHSKPWTEFYNGQFLLTEDGHESSPCQMHGETPCIPRR
ncbi:hypothetical protein AbraIFM66950_002449 [Aspergillus brasiliensis]|nr:hypothetical protein AbraIFM66950_002449 [Aspergillus brasiliensis]